MCECVPECGSKCVSGLVGVLICVWLCMVCVYQAIVYLVVRPATDILESEHSVWVKMKMRVSACVCACVCVCVGVSVGVCVCLCSLYVCSITVSEFVLNQYIQKCCSLRDLSLQGSKNDSFTESRIQEFSR